MAAGTSAQCRAAKRDYWNSPKAAKLSNIVDWVYAIGITLAIFVAGSLNF